jgi:hypothetical protein
VNDVIPNIVLTIRMFRDVRGWSFEKARDHAIEQYREKGWDIPPSIESLYGRASTEAESGR